MKVRCCTNPACKPGDEQVTTKQTCPICRSATSEVGEVVDLDPSLATVKAFEALKPEWFR